MLNNILKNGGKCGVYTIICHNRGVHYSSYDNVNEYMETYKRSCTQIELTDKAISLLPFNLPISVKEPLTYREIDKFVEDYKAESEKIKNKGLSFTDILDDGLFSRTLEKGLSHTRWRGRRGAHSAYHVWPWVFASCAHCRRNRFG